MKKQTSQKVTSVLSRLFAGLMMVSISTYAVVNAQRSTLDSALGTSSWKVVTDTSGGDDNLYNFEAKKGTVIGIDGKEISVDCSNLKGLFAYEKDVSMRLAAEGAVLLKNDKNALPLNTTEKKKVTLLGSRSYSEVVEGTMWGMVSYKAYGMQFGGLMGSVAPAQMATPLDDALRQQGFTVNETVEKAYESWLKDPANYPDSVFSSTYLVNESNPAEIGLDGMRASFTDTAIVTVGRPAKESGYYLPGDAGKADPSEFDAEKDVLGLSKDELATLKYARENFKNVIVLVNAVSMDLPELKEYADAILWIGQPGVYGLEGIARVLDGTLSPSGRMVDTYAAKASNSIAMVNQEYTFQSGNGIEISSDLANQYYEPEVESIYTGYKYYETRYYDTVLNTRNARDSIGATGGAATWNYNNEVVYSYGYGLSYTNFSETIDSVDVNTAEMTVTAKVTVKNEGDTYAGKHVVELYTQVPYTAGGIEKSAIQLIGFEKTSTLKPGESEQVTITADFQDFASWDDALEHHAVEGGYLLEEGDYYFATGNGANDALNNVLAAQGYKVSSTDGYMTADGDAALAVKKSMNRVEITESKAGVVLQNQLDSMDLAKQIDGVENFSRSDWKANWPKVYDNLTPAASMKDALTNHVYTLNANGDPSSVKFGQDYGISYTDLKPSKGEKLAYDDPRLQMFVEQYDLGDGLAALLNGDSYTFGATTVSGVEKAMPLLYLDDGPMGFDATTVSSGTSRVGELFNGENDPDYETYKNTIMRTLPTGVVVGATWNQALCEEAGEMMAQLALWNGCNLIQGPGANMHRNAYNSRNHEYYSEDGLHCGLMMSAYCGGAWSYGLACTVKHFAFNDTELNRMGVSAYMSEQRARENELRAFQIGIERQTVVGIMMGMNRAGSYFVGANPGIMQGIIRGEWAFTGFIETDMTRGTYDNARDAIAMGVDSMLEAITASKDSEARNELLASWEGDTSYATGEASNAVKEDTYFLQCIQTALKHVTWVAVNSNAMNGVNGSSHLERLYTWYDYTFIALIALTAVVFVGSLAGTVVLTLKDEKENSRR